MAEIDYSVVLDENERKKMLAEGYLPEVIDWHAKERYENYREQFLWKNAILKKRFTAVSYFEFVGDVFSENDKLMVVTAEKGYREMDVDELMEYQAGRSDVYVVPASFINGYNSAVACKDVFALVIDIDKIEPETLENIISNGNLGRMTPMPTYIVNSGQGVHFYYVFETSVPHYYKNRNILKALYNQLCKCTASNIRAKTDWHAITQPFRLPGSCTRLNQLVTGWKCSEKWDVRALAHRFGVDCSELDLRRREILSQREHKEAQEKYRIKQKQEGITPKKKKKSTWRSSLEGKEGFYQSCLERCYKETVEGSRYRSMCALVVVARKVVTVSKEQVERDLIALLVHYNRIGKRMKASEVKKALRMYNDKALETKSTTLEAWFGWKFHREAQRRRQKQEENGTRELRTRSEILEEARMLRDLRMKRKGRKWDDGNGRKSKEDQVLLWRAENPDGKPKDCIEATGLSKNTVYKWWNSSKVVDAVQKAEDELIWTPVYQNYIDMTPEELAEFFKEIEGEI